MRPHSPLIRVCTSLLLLVCLAASIWAADPGTLLPSSSILSDQKMGSVLFYNYYRADLASTGDDTEINITNTHSTSSVAVRFYFVNGTTGAPVSFTVLIAPTQTFSLLSSSVVTSTTSGHVLAVAVDSATGCPTSHNFLIGSESVKLASGYRARLGAVAFAALFSGRLSGCGAGSTTTTIAFNGTSTGYNAVSRTVALNSFPSRADGNSHLLIVNRVGGNLTSSASSIGQLSGLLYNDAESVLSFSSSVTTCQFTATLGSGFPTVTPSLDTFIPAGRSGWMKLYNSQVDTALLGATLQFNPNSFSTAGGYTGGQNLHTQTLTTTAGYTVPVSVPAFVNAPTISSISPSSATVGGSAFTLTVNGSGFTTSSVVRWRGADRATTFVSETQLRASISAGDLASAGTASVTVYNPLFDVVSSAATFTISQSCAGSFSIVPTSQSSNAAGGSGSVGVTAGPGCSWTAASNASWIAISSGASGAGNGTVSYSVALNASTTSRTGTMTIAGQTFTVTQSGGQSLAAVSAASFSTTNGLAPESVAASFGNGLATSTVLASTLPLPTTLGGSTVTVRDVSGTDRLAPLFFVSSGQVNFQVPAGTGLGTATVIARAGNNSISVGTVQVAQVAPGLFTASSTGQGAAFGRALRIKGDGSQSYEPLTEANNAARTINLGPPSDLVYLVLRGTGIRGRSSLANVAAKIGGADASVTYAGVATDSPFATGNGVGEDQVNVLVPRSLAGRGLVDVVLTVDSKVANTVQVSIGTATEAPAVASISPTAPLVSSSSQSIIVNGTSFQSGLSVTLTSPSGSAATLSGAQIQSVTATSFVMLATLNFTGIWNLRVNNSDGGQSNIFNFTVGTNCTYSINPTSQSFVAVGGTGSVAVTAGSGCGWTATSNAAWITVTSGASGNGNGTVSYSVAVNTGAARSGAITIAGQTFTVTQGCTDTAITSPPINQAVCPGSPVSFSVTATGAGTLSYQWRKNTINIPGATGSTFTIPSAVAGDAGAYSVVVTGACDSVTSSAVTLTINSAPSVTTQPVNQSVTVGGSATFTAAASGVPAPSVQWQVSTDGVSFSNVSGATSTTLTLSNVTLAQNGTRYRAVFTNSCGTATSNPATLSLSCPAINLSPTTLPNASTGAPYSQTLATSGGVAPFTFSLIAGSLPTGLSLSAAGLLSGMPTQGGTFNFTIRATDANSCFGSRAYSLTIGCAFDISPKSKNFAADGGPDSVSVIAGSGCTWTAASNESWITITGGGSGAGNGLVNYLVTANTGTSQRAGTMTIAGLTFTVTQAGVNPNPTPFISSLSPSSIAAGSAAFVLTVNGSNFVGGAVVRLNGNDRQTNFVNASQLTAQIPATDLAVASSAQITVVNPAPGGGASNVSVLTITPVVSGFTLSGRITYSDVGRPVPGAVVTSSAPGTTPISSPPSGSNGFYSISGLAAGNYIITPSKSGNVNGITAFDAARIMQRLAAGDPFAGIQRKAADVDGNDIINVGDALRIANYIVGAPDVGQVGKWTFDRESRIAGVIGNLTDQDFQAALIGDVTRTWLPDNSLAITAVSPVRLNLQNQATGEAMGLPGVMINGVGFAPGLTLVVKFPDGGEMRLLESQILDIKSDSFTALVGLPGPGLWALRVINPDGKSSDVFVVRVE